MNVPLLHEHIAKRLGIKRPLPLNRVIYQNDKWFCELLRQVDKCNILSESIANKVVYSFINLRKNIMRYHLAVTNIDTDAVTICKLCYKLVAVRDLELDHIKPLAKGGKGFDPSNLQLICRTCNRKKGSSSSSSSSNNSSLEDFFSIHALIYEGKGGRRG